MASGDTLIVIRKFTPSESPGSTLWQASRSFRNMARLDPHQVNVLSSAVSHYQGIDSEAPPFILKMSRGDEQTAGALLCSVLWQRRFQTSSGRVARRGCRSWTGALKSDPGHVTDCQHSLTASASPTTGELSPPHLPKFQVRAENCDALQEPGARIRRAIDPLPAYPFLPPEASRSTSPC